MNQRVRLSVSMDVCGDYSRHVSEGNSSRNSEFPGNFENMGCGNIRKDA